MILKTLISMLRCVWLGSEVYTAGVGQIWGCLCRMIAHAVCTVYKPLRLWDKKKTSVYLWVCVCVYVSGEWVRVFVSVCVCVSVVSEWECLWVCVCVSVVSACVSVVSEWECLCARCISRIRRSSSRSLSSLWRGLMSANDLIQWMANTNWMWFSPSSGGDECVWIALLIQQLLRCVCVCVCVWMCVWGWGRALRVCMCMWEHDRVHVDACGRRKDDCSSVSRTQLYLPRETAHTRRSASPACLRRWTRWVHASLFPQRGDACAYSAAVDARAGWASHRLACSGSVCVAASHMWRDRM